MGGRMDHTYVQEAGCSLSIFTMIMMPLHGWRQAGFECLHKTCSLHGCWTRRNSFMMQHSLQRPKNWRSWLTIFNDVSPPPKVDVAPALKSILPSHEPSSQTPLTLLVLYGLSHTHDLLVSVLWSSLSMRLQRLQVHTLCRRTIGF